MNSNSPATPGTRVNAQSKSPGPREKALRINLDPTTYGVFAEIGAGQEVARWFFRAGGASGTVAKTISAYDMAISDAIYGSSPRYVSRERLQQMLKLEYAQLTDRLSGSRGSRTRFFAFADTVAAQSFRPREECDGWLGIRFQHKIGAEPSQVLIHVRMLDREAVSQHEALGIVGVNLVDAALFWDGEPQKFLASLADDLGKMRLEVDMASFEGPAFADVDNRIASLLLVQLGLADSAMFLVDGRVVQASEVLYKKCILLDRGTFRPPTLATADRLSCAKSMFVADSGVSAEDTIVLTEMTLSHVEDSGQTDHTDFLQRVDLLRSLGHAVLVSNFSEYYRLAEFLFRYTRRTVGLTLGITQLRMLLDEGCHKALPGGILESFGRLFSHDLRLYVYPEVDTRSGQTVVASRLELSHQLAHLHRYLLEKERIRDIQAFNPAFLEIYGRDVLAKLRAGDSTWESQVPECIADLIKERRLLGYLSLMTD